MCNSSRISYGYCGTMCSGAASLPSQFVDMSVSSSQPFDWIKEQSKSPEIKEAICLIGKHKLYSRKIKKGDSSVTKALLKMKGQLKLIKECTVLEKPLWTIVLKRKPRLQLIIPGHMTKRVLNRCHNQVGCQGIVRTLSLLREETLLARHA